MSFCFKCFETFPIIERKVILNIEETRIIALFGHVYLLLLFLYRFIYHFYYCLRILLFLQLVLFASTIRRSGLIVGCSRWPILLITDQFVCFRTVTASGGTLLPRSSSRMTPHLPWRSASRTGRSDIVRPYFPLRSQECTYLIVVFWRWCI